MQAKGMARLAAIALAASFVTAAYSDDLVPPPWRFGPNTTFNHWTFDKLVNTGDVNADQFFNSFGTGPGTVWGMAGVTRVAVFGNRFNVLTIDPNGWIIFLLPNRHVPPPWWKEILVQVTWLSEDGTKDITFDPDPNPPGSGVLGQHLEHRDLADGWNWDRFRFVLDFQPEREYFRIRNLTSIPIHLDQVVIDTRCVPEPASLAALSLGALALIRRRRK